MTDLNQAAESEIRDTEIETNEIVEETLEEAAPENKDATTEPEAIASVDKAADAAPKATPPKTKAGMINAMTNDLIKSSKAEVKAAYEKMYEGVEIDDVELAVEEVDTASELAAIVEGEATLSEEFKQKTSVIF